MWLNEYCYKLNTKRTWKILPRRRGYTGDALRVCLRGECFHDDECPNHLACFDYQVREMDKMFSDNFIFDWESMYRSLGLLFQPEKKYISITISQCLIVCLVCIQCMIAKSPPSSVKILAFLLSFFLSKLLFLSLSLFLFQCKDPCLGPNSSCGSNAQCKVSITYQSK